MEQYIVDQQKIEQTQGSTQTGQTQNVNTEKKQILSGCKKITSQYASTIIIVIVLLMALYFYKNRQNKTTKKNKSNKKCADSDSDSDEDEEIVKIIDAINVGQNCKK
jgi:uncharacterized protein HemX